MERRASTTQLGVHQAMGQPVSTEGLRARRVSLVQSLETLSHSSLRLALLPGAPCLSSVIISSGIIVTVPGVVCWILSHVILRSPVGGRSEHTVRRPVC